MNSNDVGSGIAHHAARDVWHDIPLTHRHHGKGSVGGEPVGLVVTAGIVAHIVHVAEHEGHGAEARQARPCPAWERERMVYLACLNPFAFAVLIYEERQKGGR